jgi:hypothetical protein
MYIKKQNIEKVLDITFENCGKYNIHNSFDPMMMTLYNNKLEQIAKKNNYQEGKRFQKMT